MKKTAVYKDMLKLIAISLFIVFFIFVLGGSFNPLIWKQQCMRRLQPSILVRPDSSAINELNEEFNQSYDHIFILGRGELYRKFYGDSLNSEVESNFYFDELIIELSYRYILSQVTYEEDIRNHYSLDHLATPSEVLEKGADDCDGQAVLITSLLRHRGYNAFVVMGYSHVWAEVLLDDTVLTINNPKNYTEWYCKFNENTVQWNFYRFFYLFTGFFLLVFSPLAAVYFSYKRNVIEHILEYMYFFRYILVLLAAFLLFIFIVFGTIRIIM